MEAQPLPLPYPGDALKGLSSRLIESHHRNNYGGAVKRLNAIRRALRQPPGAAARAGFELNGLKREELVATNSMLLHELYFAGLGGDGQTMEPAWALALEANFGSVAAWRDEFAAMGRALGGGSGWVLLAFQPREGTLVNQWAADHTQALAGGVPLLALDMYEHAYHLDHGADAAAYVDAFMANVDWGGVYARYQAAVHAASEPFAAAPADIDAASAVLDVRREGVFAEAATMLPGAQRADPASLVREPVAALAQARGPVVVYCVYGHEVGRAAALQLRAAGVDARFLAGGIDGWARAGRPLAKKPGG
ncbi:MAG: superoxide dismutase [Rubrivivax sp.]|nr:superoxide dismutase [Rubrivivax sp.]